MIIAIDPGGRHCGVAVSHDTRQVKKPRSCHQSMTLEPRQLEDWLAGQVQSPNRIELVIYEGFRLYPWMTAAQTWSRFETCEVIGVIEYLCRTNGVATHEQLPPIKKPTAHVAPQLGWTFQTDGTQHSLDAEYHLAYYQLRLEQRSEPHQSNQKPRRA